MNNKNKVKMYGDINYSLKAWQYLRGKTNGLKQRILFMYKNIWYKVPKKPTKHRIENKNTKAHELGIDIPFYHMNHPLNILISNELSTRPHINVLLPGLSLNSLSGGPNTALILAALLAEDGEYVRFISCDVAPAEDEKLFKHIDKLLNRQASRDKISFVDASDKSKTTTIGENDIFLATAWWTAQYAKYILPETLHSVFIYLIQDYEPILHEGGTFQAHSMETYGLPHIPVINTRLLLDHLIREKVGRYQNQNFTADALCFEPALDRACFFPETSSNKKKQLLFYARPTVAKRNLFEIGVVALRAAVESGAVNSNNWETWAMGEKIQPVPLGNDMLLKPLPWMDFEEYSSRIRSADLALSLMLSPHPSYPPLEMSACGNLVVTNTYSVKTTERLKALSPNILGVDPNTESVANAIKQAAGRINAGIPSFDPLGTLNLPTNWDESLGKVAQSLLDKIKHLRKSTEYFIEPNHNKSKLETSNANVEAEPQRNAKHLLQLQTQLLPYPKWIKAHIQRRSKLYQSPENPKTITLITTVYEKTNMKFLDELSVSVKTQTTKPLQWIIVVHGPISHDSKEYIKSKEREWSTKVVIEPKPLGIMGAMKRGLDIATGDYVVPVDADDLLTKDAVQILTNSITSTDYPELIYSDEDVLVDGELSSPYLRGTFDPVLNLESSYIWHLCAIDRKCALELNLYTDNGATWCHDWDSVTRIANAGGRIEHVPEVLYHWRQHLDSTSNSGNSDPRSLDSTTHLLQELIVKKGLTRKYKVEQYPINRGSKEMYIARSDDEMPKFLWFGDLVSDFELDNLLEEDDIIVYTDGTVTIDKQSHKEVVRLLELHPSVAAVGGRVANSSGTVVDACSVSNITGERPWLGNKLNYSGPYALALKAQTVDETGKKLAFFRVGSLKKLRFKLGKPAEWAPLDIQDICAKLKSQNWHTAYSPLVIGYSECEMDVTTSLKIIPRNKDAHTNALARYGICCTHQV